MFSKKVIDSVPNKLKKYDRESVYFVSWNRTIQIKIKNFNLETIMCYAGTSINGE